MDGVQHVTLWLMGGHKVSGELTAQQMESVWRVLSQLEPVGFLRIDMELSSGKWIDGEMAIPYRSIVGVEYPRGDGEAV